MNSEEQMNMVEILSEELGEKELKIMALEKELEEQKKQKLEYLEQCEIKQYKIDFMEVLGYEEENWSPAGIVLENTDEDYELMIKVILHYFGGSIMTKEETVSIWDYGDDDFMEYLTEDEQGCVVLIQAYSNKYWVSDSAIGM